MTERPIYFREPSADAMVRAVLNGTKTQTRQPMVPQPTKDADEVCMWPSVPPMPHHRNPGVWARKHSSEEDAGDGWVRFLSRNLFGWSGDLLWVRECWQQTRPRKSDGERFCLRSPREGCGDLHYRADDEVDPPPVWRPSIHMPRWASRITLSVKRVWVEHVQEISEDDACAEGATDEWPVAGQPYLSGYGGRAVLNNFAALWDSIYTAKGHGWDENPWVWGCEFQRRSG